MIKVREVLRSDLLHIPRLFQQMQSEDAVGYPVLEKAADDFCLYLMQRIHLKSQTEASGGEYPWNFFVAIPQGNVAKGFAEVVIEQRFYGKPNVVCRVLGFFIDDKSRNRGLARELFLEVLRFGARHGAQVVEVVVPVKSPIHAFWVKSGARAYSANLVFSKPNGELFNEGDFEWASDHMQEEWPIGFMGTSTQKVQQESTETSKKEKIDLTLVKA